MSENSFQAEAPAKVNLSLRIKGRRADGFHELETRMVPISLCDTITFTPSSTGGVKLSCDDPELPLGEDNLAIKAVRAFEAVTGLEVHGQIQIDKKVPSGAGMGGGSSDAATVLLLLNEALQAGLNKDELAMASAGIGSDVPFFVYGQACDASGRGETVKPIHFDQQLNLLLIKPPFGIATPWAYSRWAESEENDAYSYAPQALTFGELVNDLERPVFEKYLVLGDLKRWLLGQYGVAAALMSGSGATVFAVLDSGADGKNLADRALAEFGETFWTQLVSTRT